MFRFSRNFNHIFGIFILNFLWRFSTVYGYGSPIVSGVIGKSVMIPCDVELHKDLRIIKWQKTVGHNEFNIYTFDVRGKRLKNGEHFTEDSRLHFLPLDNPPALKIDELRQSDEGVYVCKVDFSSHNDVTYSSNLKIIVPPEEIEILDKDGQEILEKVGPLRLDESVEISCKVQGGRPMPTVTWWYGASLLDKKVDRIEPYLSTNVISLGPLKRSDHGKQLQCQANNNNITAPLSKTVVLDVIYPPSNVEITTAKFPLIADTKNQISCRSEGGRPPADISWWMDGFELTDYKERVLDTGDTKISKLRFIPRESDHKKILECRSISPTIEHPPLVAQLELDIFYKPKVALSILTGDSPKEGENVTFECATTANPALVTINWFHQGKKIEGKNFEINENRLTLVNVTNKDSGLYTCLATNDIGTGNSEGKVLSVQYVPICSEDGVKLIGGSLDEQILINCKLNTSSPIQNFRWEFTSSEWPDISDIPKDRFSTRERNSVLKHYIYSGRDLGVFSCFGSNELGEQKSPCKFNLVKATLPDQPTNCSYHSNSTSIFIDCLEGHDGGLPQSFVVEVVDLSTKKTMGNITSSLASFGIHELPHGTDFLLTIYSVNGRGPSEKILKQAYTEALVEGGIGTVTTIHIFPITAILGVLIGVVGALVIVSLIIFVVVRLKSKPLKKMDTESGVKTPLNRRDDPNWPEGSESAADDRQIPGKLKHANLYEAPPGAKPADPKRENSPPPEPDQDDVHYAQLEFGKKTKPDKKKKPPKKDKKNNKKKDKNGEVQGSYDPTIYSSIDHVQTEKQRLADKKPDTNDSPDVLPEQPHDLVKPEDLQKKSSMKPTNLDSFRPQNSPNSAPKSSFGQPYTSTPKPGQAKKEEGALGTKGMDEDIPLMDDDTMESSL